MWLHRGGCLRSEMNVESSTHDRALLIGFEIERGVDGSGVLPQVDAVDRQVLCVEQEPCTVFFSLKVELGVAFNRLGFEIHIEGCTGDANESQQVHTEVDVGDSSLVRIRSRAEIHSANKGELQ